MEKKYVVMKSMFIQMIVLSHPGMLVVLLNETRSFSELGYICIFGIIFQTGMNCVYMIDSVKSNNTNIVSVKKGENGWNYTGRGIGTTYLTVNYHYYNNSQKVYQRELFL